MPAAEPLIRQLYIRVGGVELDAQVMTDLFRVEVDTSLTLPDMCVLYLHDRNARLVDEGPFSLGAELRVGVGDQQGRGDSTLFVGEITGLEPDYRRGMVADLLVRAYDRAHRLQRGTHTRTFQNSTDSEIATQIAQEVGLRADVDATATRHKHVFQAGLSDWAFLRERAQAIGYSVSVREQTLHFQRAPTVDGEATELEWGRELREFRPVLTLSRQVNEVTVRGWSPENKREVVGSATRGAAAPRIGQEGSAASLAREAFGEAGALVVATHLTTQEEADRLAQAALDQVEGRFIEAEGVCIGNEAVQAGSTVNITSVGQRFGGRYLVTRAIHLWDTEGDYLTHFRVTGRQGDTLRELITGRERDVHAWPAMVGIVTNNDDPDGQGRVRVRFPWLGDQAEDYWARVASPGAGSERGLLLLPEVNDEVLVCFEQGDIARPLVIGGLWNGQDPLPIARSALVANGQVNQRVLVTRTGHKLIFSEQNPALVRIETAGGHVVLLDDDQASIKISTAHGNQLTLDDSAQSIKIESAGELQIEASTNLSIHANGNLDLEASGVTTIRGATVQLNP
ncbi:MAG: VgrG-related protein [Anaerolineales bacterium]